MRARDPFRFMNNGRKATISKCNEHARRVRAKLLLVKHEIALLYKPVVLYAHRLHLKCCN